MMTDRKLNTREEADARYKWAIEDLRRIGVKEEVMPNLLYNNAAKLLKLDEEE